MIDSIIDYENGQLAQEDTVVLFQQLIDNGQAWRLQGHYGRAAHDLIESGLCMLGEVGHNDHYGNYVPSRYEVEPGSPGSPEFAARGENA